MHAIVIPYDMIHAQELMHEGQSLERKGFLRGGTKPLTNKSADSGDL